MDECGKYRQWFNRHPNLRRLRTAIAVYRNDELLMFSDTVYMLTQDTTKSNISKLDARQDEIVWRQCIAINLRLHS